MRGPEEILQRELAAFHERAAFPGGTIGYAFADEDGGEVSGSVSVGVAFKGTGEPLGDSHRLCAGSVGKTFCAAVVLGLVSDGTADLDTKISNWLGDQPWFDRLPNASDITLRHLLNHTSGIPEHVQSPKFLAEVSANRDRVWKPEELVAFVLDANAMFSPPEASWSYADTNYILVGMIVEKITGRAFYDLVRESILEPNNLDGIVAQDRRDIPNLAGGYVEPGGDLLSIEGDNMAPGGVYAVNPQFEWTGGGFATASRDLARWTRLHFRGDIVGEKMLTQMIENPARATALGQGERYGLGVQIRESKLGDVRGHGGFFPGYLAEVAFYPELDLALSIQVNTSTISRELRPRTLRATLDACAEAIAAGRKN